jgi:DNA-binding transcriptional LysR family regulator
VDVRISASNEIVNLDRGSVDLAVRYVPPDTVTGSGAPRLFGEEALPVCKPSLAADRKRPLLEPADLRRHVLLHLDDPRAAWLDWNLWLHALGLHDIKPAGMLHFSHYDQLIHAAVNGQGIALGRLPLVRQMLRDGRLVAPFKKSVVSSRSYFLLRAARSADKPAVQAFANWLMTETALELPHSADGTAPRKRKAR